MRVLLIEDDSATAQSIELMLKSENFNVYTTDLGEEGVDLGKLYDYDIIMLDLNLPDMSGFEVLRSLRVSKVKTPILILTGLALGLGLAAIASHSMSALLYGFRPDYVATVTVVSLVLLAVSALACLVPARRASRVDPMVALRVDG